MSRSFASTIALALILSSTTALAETTVTTAPHPTAVLKARQGGSTPLPLTQYSYAYSAIPYQVNPYQYLRGPQSGYNRCNATTEGPTAQCQTAVLNSVDDFCLWGAPGQGGNETIGDIEAAVVAYCTKSGHGARIMPPGTITGLQFMRTSAYIQWTGFLNQPGVGLAADDSGGELDPHGADLLGNPLGGLVYSSGLPSGDNSTMLQVNQWNNFIGGGQFCYKLCDPTYKGGKDFCQNKFDLLGCSYNMPASYVKNEFTSCEGELQDEVGTYTSNGQTLTYSQPSVLGTSTVPYTPRIPASSNCVTYQSSELFPASALGYQASSLTTSTSATSATTTSGASAASGAMTSGAASGSSRTSGAASPSATSGNTSAASSNLIVSGTLVAAVFGALVALV